MFYQVLYFSWFVYFTLCNVLLGILTGEIQTFIMIMIMIMIIIVRRKD